MFNPSVPASLDETLMLFVDLQQRASHLGTTLRPPPSPPTTCCGRGCNGCVWEAYYTAVVAWRDDALLELQP